MKNLKYYLEKMAKWITRIILLPLGFILGFYAVSRFFSLSPEQASSPVPAGSNAIELLIAGLLIYAAIYPAPPWRNKPLIHFFTLIGIIILMIGWWIGTIFGAATIIRITLGNDIPFYGLVFFVVWVVINIVIFLGFGKINDFIQKLRQKHMSSDKKPKELNNP